MIWTSIGIAVGSQESKHPKEVDECAAQVGTNRMLSFMISLSRYIKKI